MRILAIHSIYGDDENRKSAVDMWRIHRPLEELAKHVDWQIDHRPTVIPEIEKYKSEKEFTEEEMQKAFDDICQYDIVFSSYNPNASNYTLLKVAEARAGTKFIMDIDDDMFAVNEDNPFWLKMTDEDCFKMQLMIRDNTYISTTNERLAKVFRDRRDHPDDSVFVLPNYITDEYVQTPFDNGDDIVIGYFGGSSHYSDIHDTRVMDAVKRLMIENKNIRFKAVGMPVDSYLPRKRYEFVEGKRGDGWLHDLYPNLHMDIALGPLCKNIFNNGKSDIKWQEATRAGALFVATDFGPYTELKDVALLVKDNTEDEWYKTLKEAIENVQLRKETHEKAKEELKKRRLEDNWVKYKEMFERVHNADNNPIGK